MRLWIAGVVGRVDAPAPWIGLPCAAVFAAFALVALWRIRLAGEAVRVDDRGIRLWRANGAISVPWTAIRRIEVRSVHQQRFVCLWVDDPERYRASGPLGGANSAMGFGDVALGIQGTDARFADLEAAVARFAAG